jgi:hypothetical protein
MRTLEDGIARRAEVWLAKLCASPRVVASVDQCLVQVQYEEVSVGRGVGPRFLFSPPPPSFPLSPGFHLRHASTCTLSGSIASCSAIIEGLFCGVGGSVNTSHDFVASHTSPRSACPFRSRSWQKVSGSGVVGVVGAAERCPGREEDQTPKIQRTGLERGGRESMRELVLLL